MVEVIVADRTVAVVVPRWSGREREEEKGERGRYERGVAKTRSSAGAELAIE